MTAGDEKKVLSLVNRQEHLRSLISLIIQVELFYFFDVVLTSGWCQMQKEERKTVGGGKAMLLFLSFLGKRVGT